MIRAPDLRHTRRKNSHTTAIILPAVVPTVPTGTLIPTINWFEILDPSDKVNANTICGHTEFERAFTSTDDVPKLNEASRILTNIQRRAVFIATYDVFLMHVVQYTDMSRLTFTPDGELNPFIVQRSDAGPQSSTPPVNYRKSSTT